MQFFAPNKLLWKINNGTLWAAGLNWESPYQRRPKMPRKAGTLRHALLQQEIDGGERTAVGLR
jgi:hypothetical protein